MESGFALYESFIIVKSLCLINSSLIEVALKLSSPFSISSNVRPKSLEICIPSNAFNTLCNDAKNVKEGIVYSVNELSKDEIKRVEEAISANLGYTAELHNKLNPDLISGVRVVVGDVVFDGSMRNRLNSLTSELLKKAGD